MPRVHSRKTDVLPGRVDRLGLSPDVLPGRSDQLDRCYIGGTRLFMNARLACSLVRAVSLVLFSPVSVHLRCRYNGGELSGCLSPGVFPRRPGRLLRQWS